MPVIPRNSPYESDWVPGRTSKEYRDNYDKIKWATEPKETDIAVKGKAKLEISSIYREVAETKRICTSRSRTDKDRYALERDIT